MKLLNSNYTTTILTEECLCVYMVMVYSLEISRREERREEKREREEREEKRGEERGKYGETLNTNGKVFFALCGSSQFRGSTAVLRSIS